MWNVPLVRRSSWRLAQLLVVVFVALVIACSPNGEASAPPDSNLDPAIAPAGSVTPSSNVDATPNVAPATVRLASHRFVSVGDQHSIEDLGELLEVVHLSEPPAVAINGTTALAEAGGISCLRFQYRTAVDENAVQTQCIVVFDETGDCTDLEPLRLDLLTFLDQGAASAGEANMLASGDGRFYATCRTDSGAYRLQQPSEQLPPPYFHIVDALGDGAYSLGDSEFDAQRAGTIETFGGETLEPAWIVSVSLEVAWLELSADGFTANTEDCSTVPSCSPSSLAVRPGDLIRVSIGLNTNLVREFAEQADGTLLDSYLGERIGASWTDVSALNDNPRDATLMRLISLDVMDQALEEFDTLYGLREREITVVYTPFWAVQDLPNLCEPGERATCEALEEALSAEEARRIARLRESGFTLWHGAPINYDDAGRYVSIKQLVRPQASLFDGQLAWIAANSSFAVADPEAALAQVVTEFAAELDPDVPVILMLWGPPLTSQTGGAFCEAEICPSDFSRAYGQTEAWLGAALDAIPPDQFAGFGLAMFDGAHFDLREPHEHYEFFSLNRAGETGYNHPAVNIYRAQSSQ